MVVIVNMGVQAMPTLLVSLLFLSTVDRLTAQTSPPASSPSSPPIACTFSNASMVSSTSCTDYDQQNMDSLTGGCQGFLTNLDPSPSLDCCHGMNSVAYYRTACICLATFYPPPDVNAARQLQLPSLCRVTTDLCSRCPAYLVDRGNSPPVASGRSKASKAAAIILSVLLALVLLSSIIALCIIAYRRRKARQNAPQPFEGAAPGGDF